MTSKELGRFEGRKFIYTNPFPLPDGRVLQSISLSEAALESELNDVRLNALIKVISIDAAPDDLSS